MVSHTPGPWVAATSFRGIYSQHPAPGPVQVCRAPDNYDWPEQWKANARLISAAPDLLEACQRAFEQTDPAARPSDYAMLNAAIAKATGAPVGA